VPLPLGLAQKHLETNRVLQPGRQARVFDDQLRLTFLGALQALFWIVVRAGSCVT